MKSVVVFAVFFTVLAGNTLEDVSCDDLADALTEEICNVQEVIRLYEQKLAVLKAMRQLQPSAEPTAFRSRKHPVIPKRVSANYTSDAEFVPPSFVVCNDSLYDINGGYLENVPGRVLAVQPGEITTLLGRQVNIVRVGAKLSKELWGIQKELLPTLWIMYRGERMMVQHNHNRIEFTSKQVTRTVELNAPVVALLRTPSMLLFVCSKELGKVSLATLEPTYFKPSNPLQLHNMVAAAIDSNNWQTFVVLNDRNMLMLLDSRSANIVKEFDMSQAMARNQFIQPKVALLANHIFVYSRTSPKVLLFNLTHSSSIVEEPTITLCAPNQTSSPTSYDYKFSLSGDSIYIMCSRSSATENTSQLFEFPLPEQKTEELVPKWLQYLMIAMAVGVGVLYRKYRAQQQPIRQAMPAEKKSKYTVGKPIRELPESDSDSEPNQNLAQCKEFARGSKPSKDSKPSKKAQ